MCAYRGETPALVVGYSFIQSFNKDLLSTNYVPGSASYIMMNRQPSAQREKIDSQQT